MLNTLSIKPFTRPVQGVVRLPGSKSLTNRALILAALNKGPLRLEGALFSKDTRIMVRALQTLGFAVKANEASRTIAIVGQGGAIPVAETAIEVGNAGTAARFLPALLSLRPGGTYTVDGSEAMRQRPIKGLLDALEGLGAKVIYNGEPGFFPLTLYTQGLKGDCIRLDASASSQILSALLMTAPHITPGGSNHTPFTIELLGGTVSKPFVRMTLEILRQFGSDCEEYRIGKAYQVSRSKPHVSSNADPSRSVNTAPPRVYTVAPDLTAASYFLVLPMVTGGSLLLEGVQLHGGLQGDIAFATMLQDAGLLELQTTPQGLRVRSGPKRHGINRNFNAISDTFLTLAAIAPLLEGPTVIRGIGHTRRQETDRVSAVAKELHRLGQEVRETASILEIVPRPLIPAVVQTYKDHRVAMSFGILGCRDMKGGGRPWLQIEDPACCAKTFPNFFELLENLHKESHLIRQPKG